MPQVFDQKGRGWTQSQPAGPVTPVWPYRSGPPAPRRSGKPSEQLPRPPSGEVARAETSSPAASTWDLMRSVTAEEAALTELIRAEAERVRALGRSDLRPESFTDLLDFQRSVHDILLAVARRDEVLLHKMRTAVTLGRKAEEQRKG